MAGPRGQWQSTCLARAEVLCLIVIIKKERKLSKPEWTQLRYLGLYGKTDVNCIIQSDVF